MATCNLQTYYCTDNPIVVDRSILYSNNISPLIPVGPGYYSTQVGTGNGTIYQTDSTGKVIAILSPNDTVCSNQVPITYKYYKAYRFSCGNCGEYDSIVYVAVNSILSVTYGFYYTDGSQPVFDNTKVYKIKNEQPTTTPQIFDVIIDTRTGASTCEVPCYGHIEPPQN